MLVFCFGILNAEYWVLNIRINIEYISKYWCVGGGYTHVQCYLWKQIQMCSERVIFETEPEDIFSFITYYYSSIWQVSTKGINIWNKMYYSFFITWY